VAHRLFCVGCLVVIGCASLSLLNLRFGATIRVNGGDKVTARRTLGAWDSRDLGGARMFLAGSLGLWV
jgi:hypothetical protein